MSYLSNEEYMKKIVTMLEKNVDKEPQRGLNIFAFIYELLIRVW